MKIQCSKNLLKENLVLNIDLTNYNSWDLNTNFLVKSLNKWKDSKQDNLTLIDSGLTQFDIGLTTEMYSGINLNDDDYFSFKRIGYNIVNNPSSGQTSGYTSTISYSGLDITGITASLFGNHFDLNGGYLQGSFKFEGYNYELLPSRYNEGITIETLLNIDNNSKGIFYLMGLRAEDKYNLPFTGETSVNYITDSIVGNETIKSYYSSGVTTSLKNNLDSFSTGQTDVSAFMKFSEKNIIFKSQSVQVENLKHNIIAFELTDDKRLGCKYINSKGIYNHYISSNIIINTGWTYVSIVFKPDQIINNFNYDTRNCYSIRKGTLSFFINGRLFWNLNDFEEFYFVGVENDNEKQIGVPYTISWGGGSFGLKNSYHYDYNKYNLYENQNITYLGQHFHIENDPNLSDCFIPGNLSGLTINTDSTKFTYPNECDPNILIPYRVAKVNFNPEITGSTTGYSKNYFIKFNQPLNILSNREYKSYIDIYDDGFFNDLNNSNISLFIYSNENIEIINNLDYRHFINIDSTTERWNRFQIKFKALDNSGSNKIYLGLLIETSDEINIDKPIYFKNFSYIGQDILVKDSSKNQLIIEKHFDDSYIGKIQKLRIYDKAITQNDLINNVIYESSLNSNYNFQVNKGGRIIHLSNLGNNSNNSQQWGEYIDLNETIDLNNYILIY